MPSEEADGKGKEKKIDDAAAAPAAAPAPPPSRQPSSQPPPEYAKAKNAYEALWKQQSDTRPLATQAPASGAAAAARAAPEATGGGVNAAARNPAATPAPMKLHAFQKLVGDEAFIPASSLKILKRIGAGSFATGEPGLLDGLERDGFFRLLDPFDLVSLSLPPCLLFLLTLLRSSLLAPTR